MPYSKSTQRKYGENPLTKKSTFKMKYQGKHSAFPFKKFDRFKTFKESSELEGSKDAYEKSLDEIEKIKERAKNN